MREILFRGKTPYGIWFYGDHIKDRIETDGKPNEYIMIRFFSIFEGLKIENYEFIIPETIGQYTGLKDKNGKMIFEGDCCSVSLASGKEVEASVEFKDGCFILRFNQPIVCESGGLRWSDYLKCYTINHAVEIIGNVHDNPELLK